MIQDFISTFAFADCESQKTTIELHFKENTTCGDAKQLIPHDRTSTSNQGFFALRILLHNRHVHTTLLRMYGLSRNSYYFMC